LAPRNPHENRKDARLEVKRAAWCDRACGVQGGSGGKAWQPFHDPDANQSGEAASGRRLVGRLVGAPFALKAI